MSYYPPEISERFLSAAKVRSAIDDANAEGTAASFDCGSFATLSLLIDDSGFIDDVEFRTNGCGFMVASADVLCEWLRGKAVTHLHGLDDLSPVLFASLGEFPADRLQCSAIVFEALRKAMAGYRERRIAEFRGDVALICTCFGVSEETITDLIAGNHASSVEQVSEICRAGSGCGSCRMLIQEMIDARG